MGGGLQGPGPGGEPPDPPGEPPPGGGGPRGTHQRTPGGKQSPRDRGGGGGGERERERGTPPAAARDRTRETLEQVATALGIGDSPSPGPGPARGGGGAERPRGSPDPAGAGPGPGSGGKGRRPAPRPQNGGPGPGQGPGDGGGFPRKRSNLTLDTETPTDWYAAAPAEWGGEGREGATRLVELSGAKTGRRVDRIRSYFEDKIAEGSPQRAAEAPPAVRSESSFEFDQGEEGYRNRDSGRASSSPGSSPTGVRLRRGFVHDPDSARSSPQSRRGSLGGSPDRSPSRYEAADGGGERGPRAAPGEPSAFLSVGQILYVVAVMGFFAYLMYSIERQQELVERLKARVAILEVQCRQL